MEIDNKCSNTGEVVGVEGKSTGLPLYWGGSVIVGEEQEPLDFGAGGIMVSSEEYGIVFGEHHDSCLI